MSGKKLHVMMVNYWDFKLTSPASQGNANAHVKGGRRDLTFIRRLMLFLMAVSKILLLSILYLVL